MNAKTYDLYGLKCNDINVGKILVEKILQIKMIAHESSYHCGEYFRFKDVGEEHYILQKNYDDFEGEWTEDGYTQYPLLLYVNETLCSDKIVNLFKKEKRIDLLKHQEI